MALNPLGIFPTGKLISRDAKDVKDVKMSDKTKHPPVSSATDHNIPIPLYKNDVALVLDMDETLIRTIRFDPTNLSEFATTSQRDVKTHWHSSVGLGFSDYLDVINIQLSNHYDAISRPGFMSVLTRLIATISSTVNLHVVIATLNTSKIAENFHLFLQRFIQRSNVRVYLKVFSTKKVLAEIFDFMSTPHRDNLIVIDDRNDVWEPDNRATFLFVTPLQNRPHTTSDYFGKVCIKAMTGKPAPVTGTLLDCLEFAALQAIGDREPGRLYPNHAIRHCLACNGISVWKETESDLGSKKWVCVVGHKTSSSSLV